MILQTHYPDHPLLSLLLERGYHEYAQTLLQERRQRAMPPYGRLLLLRADARDAHAADSFLQRLRDQVAPQAGGGTRFVGPAPAPLQVDGGRGRASR